MAKLKRDYYFHRKGGKVFDYSGRIGKPFKVSFLRAMIGKALGYKMTHAPRGASEQRVIIRAALKNGAHRRSYKIQKIKKEGHDNG